SGTTAEGLENHSRWRWQIQLAASMHGYASDLGRHRRWVMLRLPDPDGSGPGWSIVVSFHYRSPRTEIMAVTLFLTTADDHVEDVPVSGRPFTLGAEREFTYSGHYPQEERFSAWLDAALTNALEEWQARI